MVKKVSLICCVLVLAVSLNGCCNEEKCKQEYNLSECTKQECLDKHWPGGGTPGPEGPDVDLGPGDGNELVWEIDEDPATPGASVFDAANYCKLRMDFIGKEIDTFMYKPKTQGAKIDAEEIHLVSGDIFLKISRASSGSLNWWIMNKDTEEACTLVSGPIPATVTELPSEFIGLTHSQGGDVFKEIYDKKKAEALEIKVD